MAILEILLRGSFRGKPNINRWNYVSSGTPAAVSLSFALTAAFGAIQESGVFPTPTVMAQLHALLGTGYEFREIQVRDVYSVTDFYVRPFVAGTAGLNTGEQMAPFVTYGFSTNRVRTDVHRGTKRFSGVLESLVGDEGILTSGALDALGTLADLMSDTLTYDDEGNTLTFVPSVCGKLEYTAPSGKRAYKYYATASDQLAHTAQGVLWSPYSDVRSQTSRQPKAT